MLGTSEAEHSGNCRFRAEPLGATILPGRVGHRGRLFRLWYRFRGDLRDRRGNPQALDRRQLLEKSIPLQKKLFALGLDAFYRLILSSRSGYPSCHPSIHGSGVFT